MVGSLILTCLDTIPNIDFSLNVQVNGQDRLSILKFNVEGIYSTYLNTNDLVTIEVNSPQEFLVEIDVVRRDYTTDNINSDDGIRDTSVTQLTGVTPNAIMNFSATNDVLDYNFEYRLTVSFGNYPQCLISGFTTGSTLLPSILIDDLVFYANGNTGVGTDANPNTNNRYWINDRGNINGVLQDGTNMQIWDGGFINMSQTNMVHNLALIESGVTFGGWIQKVDDIYEHFLFDYGFGIIGSRLGDGRLKLRRNINNFGDYYECISTVTLNPDSNVWQYVMFQWINGIGLNIFLDGVKVATVSNGTLTTYGIGVLTITASSSGYNVANVQSYWKALTEAQILNNYNQLKSYFRR